MAQTISEEIKQLESIKDTLQKRLNQETDQFFIYGMVKQIEEIDKKISSLKTIKNYSSTDKTPSFSNN